MRIAHNVARFGFGAVRTNQKGESKRWSIVDILPIIFMPFTSAFAIGDWMPLSLASGLLALAVYLGSVYRKFNIRFRSQDMLLLSGIACGLIGLFFSPGYGQRTFNHSLAIVVSAFVYYFFYRDNILKSLSLIRISEVLAKVGLAAGIFILVEFIAANFLYLRFSTVIPYKEIEKGEELVFDSLMLAQWLRPRGFAIEAGHMASFFEVTVPLSLIWLRTRKVVAKCIYIIPTIVGFLLLASAAGITALSTASVIVLVKSRISPGMKSFLVVIAIVAGIVTTSSGLFTKYIEPLVAVKALGFFGIRTTDDMSALDRSARAMTALGIVKDYPMGIGWGTAAHLSKEANGLNGAEIPFGFVSLYAEFLVAGGWFGLLFLVTFIMVNIFRLWVAATFEALCVLCAMISVSIHFGTMSNYWFPAFWLPFAVALYVGERSNTNGPFFASKKVALFR